MIEKEEDDYLIWYARGSAVSEEINRTIARIVKGFENSDNEFDESAFFDGLRDNLTVDPLGE